MENRKKTLAVYLDDKVVLTMIVLSLLALMVSAFRYKNHEPCMAFAIKMKASFYQTGEPIHFETDALFAQEFHWEFGDNQSADSKLRSVIHTFDTPGEYTVALTINGQCTEYKTIYITRAAKVENPLFLPTFVCPQEAVLGKAVTFTDTTNGARSWEWRFGETAAIDATSSTASYVYKTPGLKTISLVINNNPQQIAVCKVFVNVPSAPAQPHDANAGGGRRGQSPIIVVQAKPTTPALNEQITEQPAAVLPKPKAPSISREELEGKLRMVASNFFSAEGFAPYLANNLNIPVSVNGKECTFIEFCNQLRALKGEKKIKDLNVQQIKSSETNAIISMNVNLKLKKGFLGLF